MWPLFPWYLLGTVSAGIPIIIHMIHKRRAQRVLFPTIRFLKASNERTSRRQKIQDLLLLLLRCLLLILLSVALAQFVLGRNWAGGGRGVHAVILVDNSYSMGTEHEGKTRFQAGKSLATTVVDCLPKGSHGAVMLACPPHNHPGPMLTDNPAKLREDILKAPLSQARADLTAAVQRAHDFLAEHRAANNEIYVVTDLQRNAWSPPGRPDEPTREEKPEANVLVIDCGREDHRNAAVADMAVDAGARTRERPVTIQAKIHNYTEKTRSVNVTLYVDRTKQANQQLDIPGDVTASASFDHVFAEPGIHSGWVQIDEDSLALDNRRDFCIEIQDHIPAIILREGQADISYLDPAFFVSTALNPFGHDPSKPRSLIQTTVADFGQVSHDLLQSFKVVLLMDIGAFRPSHIAVLRRYVRRGGRLIIFCGPNVRPKSLTSLLNDEDPKKALMPLEAHGPAHGLIDRTKFKSLVGIQYEHSALRIFKGYRLPQTVKVYNYAPIDVPQDAPTRLLIQLSDGNPFLLENRFHNGRVLLFTTSTDPDWSNLAASRFLLPLMHRLVYYLTEREEVEPASLVGTPVNITLRDVNHPVTVQVRDPDGDVIDVEAKAAGGATRATFRHTDKRGPYIYLVLDPRRQTEKEAAEAKGEVENGFVVNIDSRESDLTRMPWRELRGLLKNFFDRSRLHYAGLPERLAPGALKGTIDQMREGVPLRNLFLYIVLFIAIFETFFANKIMPALQSARERRAAPIPPVPAEG